VLLTLSGGLHEASAPAFVNYGVVLCSMKIDAQLGHEYGQLAISIVDKLNARQYDHRVIVTTAAAISHWVVPLQDLLPHLTYGFRRSLENGDAEVSLWAQNAYINYSIYTGVPLSRVEHDVEDLILMSRIYKNRQLEHRGLMLLQFIYCYTGRCGTPSRLNGDVACFDNLIADYLSTRNMTNAEALILYSLELAYMFGDYEQAKFVDQSISSLGKYRSTLFISVETDFYRGLVAAALSQDGVDRHKNSRLAMEMRTSLKQHAKLNRSRLFKLLLLEAEIASLKKKKEVVVRTAYEKALQEAEVDGYTQYVALIHERLADFTSDEKSAEDHWRIAFKLYSSWGASAKAQHVHKKFNPRWDEAASSTSRIEE
jgi:hypothetical protein